MTVKKHFLNMSCDHDVSHMSDISPVNDNEHSAATNLSVDNFSSIITQTEMSQIYDTAETEYVASFQEQMAVSLLEQLRSESREVDQDDVSANFEIKINVNKDKEIPCWQIDTK